MLDVNRTKEYLSIPVEDVLFHMEIRGQVYGIAPQVSFRRVKPQQYESKQCRKQVKCPHCSARLADADADAKVKILTNPHLYSGLSQFYHKCNSCGNEIGVSIVHVA